MEAYWSGFKVAFVTFTIFFVLLYDDDDVILQAVKDIREKGVHINEVYSPFPIHGLDHALGLKPTRLAITSFIYGCTGLS